MINFAELKDKLLKFDEKYNNSIIHGYTHEDGSKGLPPYLAVAKHQHTKDAKIISQLLDVIEKQSRAVSFLNKLVGSCAYSKNDIWGDKMESVYRSTNNILSETESKLKQLIQGE